MDVRKKLVELLKANFYDEYEFEEIADDLIAHGVTVQDNIEISDELLELLRKAPITVMTEEPTVEVVRKWIPASEPPTRKDADKYGRVLAMEMGMIVLVHYNGPINYPDRFTYWMPLPQPPKGE